MLTFPFASISDISFAVEPRKNSALNESQMGAVITTNDFFATFGLRPKQVVDPTLRTMLTPAGGPTAADMSCADDH